MASVIARPRGAVPDKAGLEGLCRELRRDLGPFGYQWLCSCAVFPGVRFTLSVLLGHALAQALQRPAPDEEEHAALFRLPWFRKGWMPDDLRVRLIADLVPEAAAATRQAIEHLTLAALDPRPPATPGEPLPLPTAPPGWADQVRAWVESAPVDAVQHDAILARFVARRPVSARALARDRWLRRRLGSRITTALDRRTVTAALLAPVLAFLAVWQSDAWIEPWFERTLEEPRQIETFRECAACPEMVVIPGGTFLMGSAVGEDGYPDERPQHRVTVAEFAISRREVTFDEWDACVADGGCEHEPSDQGWGRGQRPVIDVSWDDAQAYGRWLSKTTGAPYRLPSEAEWEYAARAGTETAWWWGERASTSMASLGTAPEEVGGYPPNPWGLHDTAGNVWEWVEDCWHDDYTGAPRNGSPWLEGTCDGRVVRGGSWLDDPGDARSACRGRDGPVLRDGVLGFRVSRTLTP